jgi:hypothetical protein
LDQDIEGYVSLMANHVKGWSKEQVTIYCAHLRNEIRDLKHHIYFRQRVVWGRKPVKKD